MVSRSYYAGAQGYRYGFNGKENDRDVKGDGNEIDYGMRIYDPRIAKFLSVDPLTAYYSGWTPFAYAMNRPIDGVDLDGLEWAPTKDKQGTITGYTWAGYNSDGKPKEGTVEGDIINKGNYTYWYTSDAKNKTGQINIFSNKKAAIKYPEGTDRTPLYNYTINIKQIGDLTFSWKNYAWSENGKSSEFDINVTVWDKPSDNFFFFEAQKALGFGASRTSIDAVYPETILLPLPKGLGLLEKSEVLLAKTESVVAKTEGVLLRETGGFKQWLRLGSSYSREGGFKTFGLRWGASGKYVNRIGNSFLKKVNLSLRNFKIPISSWRTADPGHLHFWRE